ncbi:MAG: helix-turn-helix transcriptional regulator, partial [Deltaproteobacteria bacterium]|nr:helix-turn-helix transcriptional regulator [Deltaproteobacteria bacterium]
HIIQAYKNAAAHASLAALSVGGNSDGSARSPNSLGLTHREAEVLYWVAQGKTNSDVAVILNMASGTVKRHLENIYQKLGVENRVAATRVIMEKFR